MAYKDLDSTRSFGEPCLPFVLSPSLVPGPAAAAARRCGPVVMPRTLASPTILVFDSGLGGLTVFREIVTSRPDARLVYAADDAVFPTGRMNERAPAAPSLAAWSGRFAALPPASRWAAANTPSRSLSPPSA